MLQPSKPHQLCQYFYELALWLTVALLCLVPIHSAFEKHANLSRVADSSTIGFQVQEQTALKEGSRFPVYRFFSQLTVPIGYVTISAIQGNEVSASYDPGSFKWPIGRHGRVLEIQGSTMKVDTGLQLRFQKGDILAVFKGRELIGKIQLQELGQEYAQAQILYMKGSFDKGQLMVSEYTVATQVVMLTSPWVAVFEIGFIVLVILLHSYLFIFRKISLFYWMGGSLRDQFIKIRTPKLMFIFNLLIGIPFVWFVINFFPRLLFYTVDFLNIWCFKYIHFYLPLPNLEIFLNQNATSLYIAAGAVYLAILINKERSPIALFWQWAAFKSNKEPFLKGFYRDLLIWSLHMIIFYAFGHTLWGFLNGNMNAVVQIIWPGAQVQWYQVSSWMQLPVKGALTSQEFFSVLRYLLWSVTIVGCMFGYGYSVFGYLWGKKIRNLDFTVMGWVTNAVCYGPLLGGILGQMTPDMVGRDPIVTQGPLMYFNLILEAILNLLYTLTIWNLGRYFGVMTDKGVRTTGFYSVVRHPSYTLEALMFVMIYLNGFSSGIQWLAIIHISIFTYYVRSEREDQFMAASNPQYVAYQSKTPYKFIPGVY